MSVKRSQPSKPLARSDSDTENKSTLQIVKAKQQIQFKNWQLLIAIVLLLGSGFILGQRSQPQQPETIESSASSKKVNILPVETTVIEPVQSYSSSQAYTGEVTALRTSEVGFERGGKLVEVYVEEGDRISANTPLAKLDTANLEAQRQGLIAQKEQEEAVLAELKNGARTEEITAAQAKVGDLQQQLELEKLKSSRREYLYDEGAIAREQLDEIAFNRKALNERLANAQSNLA